MRAIRQINEAGGSVEYGVADGTGWRRTLQRWFGVERFGTPEFAELGVTTDPGRLLQSMQGFRELSSISLSGCALAPGDLVHLSEFPKLQTLMLDGAVVPPADGTRVSPKGLAQLAPLNADISFPQWSPAWFADPLQAPPTNSTEQPDARPQAEEVQAEDGSSWAVAGLSACGHEVPPQPMPTLQTHSPRAESRFSTDGSLRGER